ncbi:hypothetical protein CVS40_10945 [Lucilia cuprina]|nr:hypothetical protein CVS40_10945 [Lucilia cuprina]
MKLLQYNCQSLRANRNTIEYFLNNRGIDIACLSEVYAHDTLNQQHKLLNFNIIKKMDRLDGYGGVAIALRKSIQYKRIEYNTHLDILMIKTMNLTTNLVICSVNFEQSISTFDFNYEVQILIDFLQNYEHVILAGDFNARAKKFGDYADLPRRIKQVDTINMSNFKCLNDLSPTFKRDLNGSVSTVLDLTFTNTDCTTNWSTEPMLPAGSHHYPIVIEIVEVNLKVKTFLAKGKLLSALKEVNFDPNMNEIESVFTHEIKHATYELKDRRTRKAWWNNELVKLFRLQLAARKKCDKYPTVDNFNEATSAISVWKEAVINAKRKSYEEQIRKLNEHPNSREVWRFVGSINGGNTRISSPWNNDNNQLFYNF